MRVLQPEDHDKLNEVIKELDSRMAENPLGTVTLVIVARKCHITGTKLKVQPNQCCLLTEIEIDRAWTPV